MSNRRKLKARKVPNPTGEAMYEAQRKAAAALGDHSMQPLNRRVRRALRRTVRGVR